MTIILLLFEDIIEILQQVRVLDYGDMRVLHDNVDGVRSSWDEVFYRCQGEELCMGGVLHNPSDAIDRRLSLLLHLKTHLLIL